MLVILNSFQVLEDNAIHALGRTGAEHSTAIGDLFSHVKGRLTCSHGGRLRRSRGLFATLAISNRFEPKVGSVLPVF